MKAKTIKMDVTNTDEHNNERNSLLPKAKMIRSKTDFSLIVALQGLYLASFGMYSVIGPFYMLKAKGKEQQLPLVVYYLQHMLLLYLSYHQ